MDQPDTRLAALHRYDDLDTDDTASFRDIAAVAALLCKTPIAAINFIDGQNQWSKAAVGIDNLNMPADAAICSHTIGQAGVFVVNDIAADSRFEGLADFLKEPFPRSYAGAPIETPDGFRIGTLCVLDTEKRSFTDGQKTVLGALARHAVAELELRRTLLAERTARQTAERLVAEKDALLERNAMLMQEIDHRVKNSLQVVASMLRLQGRRVTDGEAGKALVAARQRVMAIAAVHEQLYRASGTDMVNVGVFLKGLCASLAQNKPDNIAAVEVSVKDGDLYLPSAKAMQMGVIVSELVANSFKHAYPPRQQGGVHVEAFTTDGDICLRIRDAGVGMAFGNAGGTGLGMRLVRGVVDQLGATMTMGPGTGTALEVRIPRESRNVG